MENGEDLTKDVIKGRGDLTIKELEVELKRMLENKVLIKMIQNWILKWINKVNLKKFFTNFFILNQSWGRWKRWIHDWFIISKVVWLKIDTD